MIREWIISAATSVGQTALPLAPSEVGRLVTMIRQRYTLPEVNRDYLWESFKNDVARRNTDGWRVACDYPVKEPVLLFQEGPEFQGFQFATREALRQTLTESPGFEFYLTDDGCSFAMCFNHHDFLIGVGACAEWLSHLSEGECSEQKRGHP